MVDTNRFTTEPARTLKHVGDDEAVLASVRMQDQMLSCLDFVIEKADEFYPEKGTEGLSEWRESLARKRRDTLARLGVE